MIERLHQYLLNSAHCLYLIICACYIALMYPMAWPACLILGLCGIGVAVMPLRWRQRAIGEMCFLAGALIASALQWYLHQQSPESIHGLCRIILATLVLVLVPNRPGLVRPLTMLIALELMLLDKQELSYATVLFLSIFALSALFLDAWLRQQFSNHISVRIRNRWASKPWKSMLLCIALLTIISLPLSHYLQQLGAQHRFNVDNPEDDRPGKERSLVLDDSMRLGSSFWSDQDPYRIGFYVPDRSESISSSKNTYIRSRTVPLISLDSNGELLWDAPKKATAYTGKAIEPIPLGSGSTMRLTQSADKKILRPDGSGAPVFKDFYFDSEGNYYSTELSLGSKQYRCGIPKAIYTRDSANAGRLDNDYLKVPPIVQRLFQQHIPQLEQWRILSAEQAAQQIVLYLHRRCRYAVKNLPKLNNTPAHSLELFLFGEDHQRIGHCQYFSTAATLLMRSCGHPCRPVFGYASNEVNTDSDGKKSLVLRAWHGHAWTEFIDNGNWNRLEATPPDYLAQRIQGAELPEDEAEVIQNSQQSEIVEVPLYIFGLILIPIAVLILLIVYIIRKKSPAQMLNARERQLALQQQALLNCAKQLGITVKQSHTLSHIIKDIELKSGIDLQFELRDHLAALYNHAEIPKEWPILRIQEAAKKRQLEFQQQQKNQMPIKN